MVKVKSEVGGEKHRPQDCTDPRVYSSPDLHDDDSVDDDPFESSCLARTPSGSIYIPSSPSEMPKITSQQHQQQQAQPPASSSPGNSPKKGDSLKTTNPDRFSSPYSSSVLVPNVPVRNNLRRPTSNHFSSHSRFQLRKRLSSQCSWKCTAVVFILLTIVLAAALTYFAATSVLRWQQDHGKPCPVSVEDSGETVVVSSTELNSRYNWHVDKRGSAPRLKRYVNDDEPSKTIGTGTTEVELGSGDQIMNDDDTIVVTADENSINPITNSKSDSGIKLTSPNCPNAIAASSTSFDDNKEAEGVNGPYDEGFLPVESVSNHSLRSNSTKNLTKSGETDSNEVVNRSQTGSPMCLCACPCKSVRSVPEQLVKRERQMETINTNYTNFTNDSSSNTNNSSSSVSNMEMAEQTDNRTIYVALLPFPFNKGRQSNPSPTTPPPPMPPAPPPSPSSLHHEPHKNTIKNTITPSPTVVDDHDDDERQPLIYDNMTIVVPLEDNLDFNEKLEPIEGVVDAGPTVFPAKTLPPDSNTFMEIMLGRRGTNDIPPYGHWNTQFHQPRTAFVRFNYTVPRDASLGVYGRRNAIPTHTQYDFVEILSDEEKRKKRNLKETINIVFVQYLDAGQWYLSMYNDDDKLRDVSFITSIADDLSVGCPYDCHDHGTCVRGVCQCYPGYTSYDCSRSVCPVLCTGNGEYLNGHCLCKPGWKGKECNLRYDECEVPGCNGHGHCIDGKCRCAKGYKGEFCELVDCLVPDCASHGVCVEGSCICHRGWKGDSCDEIDSEVRKCLPDCSGHGRFDLEKVKCVCDPKWTGPDCSKELCDIDCGPFGRCESGRCHCDEGWTGAKCDIKTCDPRCSEHGQCKNGTCICIQGWNGQHCTLDGCPSNCHSHGDCVQSREKEWACHCNGDWEGISCGIALERNCNDGKDNDNDGLTDCEDSECCLIKSCSDNLMCLSTADPLEILLKKQPPAITASFFQRMRFLIEEDSVQNYVRKNAFNESRASVVRGRVVSAAGSGIVGIRVSTSNSQEGFTLTRQSGWFDLMVNGGGSVILQFQRDPFKPTKRAVMVPWNEVIIIENVVMSMKEEADSGPLQDPCVNHDYDMIKPVVLASWKHEFLGGCPEKSTILAESQVLQESLTIPGTDLHLVYHSSRAGGYLSTIQLQLTPDQIPKTLRRIHLRISIEGILFEQTFEADPGLKFTYAWNRRNVYRQRVYGVTTATVSVGYQYNTCKTIIWDVQTIKLSGHDMSISDIGGWNLDIHHRYNFHEGILQKGDGTNIYLRFKPRVILTTMGNGQQRPLDCSNCNGVAQEQRLVAPVALAAAPDGSLFVGDFNLVRRILPDRTVQTVLKLNPALVSYRYHLAVNPADGSVHLSDPERHQILRIKSIDEIADLENNYEVVIGSGDRCLPGDKNNCGDGGSAKDAKLMYPKGLVFSSDGIVYFADGTNVRMVDKNGIIHTLIGDHRHKGHWKPIPCHGTLNIDEIHLRWPTELSMNPLDGSLHIIDDHLILRLTPDGRVKVVAGQPLHCPSHGVNKDSLELASHTTLIFPESVAFSPTGELYIAESDSQRINRIRVIGTDGKIANFAGVESKCNCLERDCKCFDEDHYLASLSKLSTISSIAVTPDGVVHIADQGNLRVRSVMATLPEPNHLREYEIYSPETQEVYVFNRYGLHVNTRNILTGKVIYYFTYNLNTSFGKLSSITDAAGNKIFMLRDYSNSVNTIENTHGQKVQLTNTRMKMMQDFITPGSYNVTFDYHGSTGLLKSKRDSLGQAFIYLYDENGRVTEAVTPSGELVQLNFDLSVKGAEVRIIRDRESITSMQIKGTSVTNKQGMAESQVVVQSDGTMTLKSPWERSVIIEATSYPILMDLNPVLGESFPVPSRQKILLHDDLVHRLEWRYYIRKDGKGRDKHVSQVIRKLKVNGDSLLAVEYDRDINTETLFDHNQLALLIVTYDGVGRPERLESTYNLTSVELKYDRFGRLAQWRRGDMSEHYGFDREGRLAEVRHSDGAVYYYKFEDPTSGMPTEIMLPSGRRYSMHYDETGGLHSVLTPRGHRHEFLIQTSLGFYKLQYTAPSMRQPFVIQYNDRGEVLAKIYPGPKGRVSYIYDSDGKLQAVVFGDSKIEYTFYGDTGLIKTVSVDASDFDCRTDYKYHGDLLKEEKTRFGNKLGLNNVRVKYQYDGNAHFQRCELEIGTKEVYPLNYNYNGVTGLLENVMQFAVKRIRLNETVTESKSEPFSKTRRLDGYGRTIELITHLNNREIHRVELTYNQRSRIRRIMVRTGGGVSFFNYTYTLDGLLEEVAEAETWKYRYDENGNVISITQGKKEVKLRYNEGDRVIGYGDYDMNMIDNRGFLTQKGEEKYLYNARAQLISAAHRNLYEVHYHYDSLKRLVARKDTHGNITQYFYTNIRRPKLLTHIHDPKLGQTYQLTYDDRGHLIYLEHRNSNTKYFAVTDHLGSPMVVYDLQGSVVKEMRRSPFGALISDSNPHLYLPVDFQGGLRDPITGMIHFGDRVYDPVQIQWMTPDWENILDYVDDPQTMYLYRFRNNDPVNEHHNIDYYTELTDWLPLFGYNMDDITGLQTKEAVSVHQPSLKMPNSKLPVISGLSCAANVIKREFHRLSFVPTTRVKVEPHFRSRRPRIAQKKPVFGDGVLVSRLNGRAVVNVVEGASQVVQDVVMAVLNNSHFLDIHFISHGQDMFHFVKEGPSSKVIDDHNQLQRLSGIFNVSMHDSEHGKDLKIHGHSASINIRYGTTVEQERHRLLKQARKRSITTDRAVDGGGMELVTDNLLNLEFVRRNGRRRRRGGGGAMTSSVAAAAAPPVTIAE